MQDSQKKIKWYMLCFMAFSTLWGFGNVVNGFVFFNGIQVIFSWVLMFVLYFIPYALMVGELGSAFKDEGGGVTSWMRATTTDKIAYYAGWTYWAVHITYIASKGSGGLKALSWMIYHNAEFYDSLPTVYVQIATLCIFLFFCWVASRGLNPLKKLATIAGSSMFIMGILYILMMLAAPKINPNGGYLKMDWSFDNIIPTFDMKYFTSLSILVFAVGGIEKMSPYVNNMDGDPAKEFPKSMIFAAIMVVVSAIFGTIAMGMMFDPTIINADQATFDSYAANGAYWAFQKLGDYYGVGNLIMVIYALCNMIGQFSTLVVSIDAPLRMLLDDDRTNKFIPRNLLKKNKYGAYKNGIKLVVVLSGSIILAQILVPGAATVLRQLTKLNSIMMPLRYLWVFLAYIYLRKNNDKFDREFKFSKNNGVALFFGFWCFLVTAFCCVLGMASDDPFQLKLNIITPVVLIALGVILPVIRAKEDKKLS
ncbi:amino acid permease [Peptoniphilus lacydonensis]|uniref:APC family permease n=1 Tax=Peptoniphilus lacydonensis TaxID=1673725 RepID=UPI00290D9435|nr:amino acid permease [Peptoniphilus lacydonensis]MDU5377326.1 amino acid permease [Peptoniphilus lacydonensis]MDU5436223.1 amino acid permease [Peptoniphilus lacydonensis]